MNILVEYYGKSGSGPLFTLEFVKGLLANGHTVYSILSSEIENRDSWNALNEIKKIIFIYTGNRKEFITASVKCMFSIKKIIRKEFGEVKFDIIFRTFPHPWMEITEKYVNKTRVASMLHDPIPHSSSNIIRRIIASRNVKTSTDIIVLSKIFIEQIVRQYDIPRDRIHFMRHGKMPIPVNSNQINYFDENKANFLFFGKIEGYKGLNILAEAFKNLIKKFDNISLTVVGSGDFSKYEEQYKNLKNTIVINRYIENSEIAAFFGGPNIITILPYIDASQSGVIPIALQFNSVIIASATGGLVEQLDEGNIGLFFESGNSYALEERMTYIIEHPECVVEQIGKMREFFDKLDWKGITNELLEKFMK